MSGGAPQSEPASNSKVQGRIAADVQRAAAISSNASGRRRTVSRHLASGGDDREPMKASVSGAHGAEARRDRVPGLEVRVGPWPMQDDAPDRPRHARADFEQHEAQAPDLGARKRRAIGTELELLQQHVRRGRQDHAQSASKCGVHHT